MRKHVLDTTGLATREINMVLKELSRKGEYDEIVLENPEAKHHLAAGLINTNIILNIMGSTGFYTGTMINGPRIHIYGNSGWYPGDNMTQGEILIDGCVGDGCGQGLYGGNIVVKGDAGSRLGQIMKAGTIVVKGTSQFMTGLYMQGGRIICLDDVGESCGESIIGGTIYVAGRIRSLGKNAKLHKVNSDEKLHISKIINSYELGSFDDYDFKKIVPEKKRPFYYAAEKLKLKKTNLTYEIKIDGDLCNNCGICVRFCPKGVFSAYDDEDREIRNPEKLNSKHIENVVPKKSITVSSAMSV